MMVDCGFHRTIRGLCCFYGGGCRSDRIISYPGDISFCWCRGKIICQGLGATIWEGKTAAEVMVFASLLVVVVVFTLVWRMRLCMFEGGLQV